MSEQKQEENTKDRLAHAYDRMLERVRHTLDTAEKRVAPTLEHALKDARERAVELGEITREEADKVADYVRQDLHDMAEYLNETSRDYREWFRMDLQLIEAKIMDMLGSIADRTRVEIAEIAARAAVRERHTGEIAGPGVLACTGCGEELHFKTSGHIPPCPKCRNTTFRRIRGE
ncbi:zinc ribbon-containing protein [Thioalkalivibrio thiocyanodenitrificans]|uniref:zinc ribbon-containing protein n=1 Tax=Thioalkalivibrio thiocyanodenitrificans TaxID=243063 RepID=UPI000367C26C|nr:zinc ribbon-containing protein [Thioalkalivibrio thiocyanodenitrificans]